MKTSDSTSELIISAKYPIKIVKGEYIVNSSIRTGFLILGPGYMSQSAFFVEPDQTHKLQDVIDFEDLEVFESYRQSNYTLSFEGLTASCLRKTDKQRDVPDQVLVFIVTQRTTCNVNKSPLLSSHVVEKFSVRPPLPFRIWSKTPYIRSCLPELYNLASSDDSTVSLVFHSFDRDIVTVIDESVSYLGTDYFAVDFKTLHGRIYLLGNTREELKSACQYIQHCLDIGKAYHCYITFWGYHIMRQDNGDFVLLYKPDCKIQTSLYFNIQEKHKQIDKDFRAEDLLKQLKKPDVPNTELDQSQITQQDILSSDIELPVSNNTDLKTGVEPSKNIIGHIVHTHIIKYESSCSGDHSNCGSLPKLDESVFTSLSSELLESYTVHGSLLNCDPKLLEVQPNNLKKPLDTSFLGNISVLCSTKASNNELPQNKKETKKQTTTRKPINDSITTSAQINEPRITSTRAAPTTRCPLLDQLSYQRTEREQFKMPTVPTESKRPPLNYWQSQPDEPLPITDKSVHEMPQQSTPSKPHNSPVALRSTKKSATKPRLLSHTFKEDAVIMPQATTVDDRQPCTIRDFSAVVSDSRAAPTHAAGRPLRPKLTVNANSFRMPPPEELMVNRLKQNKQDAVDYFAGF